MHTLTNNDTLGFRTHNDIHPSASWRTDSPAFAANQIRAFRTVGSYRSETTEESQPIPKEPETPELPDDDFPFSALIRFVRLMRRDDL